MSLEKAQRVILEERVKNRHTAWHDFKAAQLIDRGSFLTAGSTRSRCPMISGYRAESTMLDRLFDVG
jgi:hypothetical protein